jgi:hypothetical protein
MNEYRYILEKSSRKHICPGCNKKTFVRYVDTVTGEHLPEIYGRCDRESKCSYHLNPYLDGYSKMIWEQEQGNKSELPRNWKPRQKTATQQPEPEPVYFDNEAFLHTLQPDRYEHNVFIQNLLKRVKYPFEANDIESVISLYRLGTIANGYRAGAVTFPFIDIENNIRAVQVKKFDKTNHTTGTDFLHSIIEKHHTRKNEALPEWLRLYNEQEKRVSCLFGEHLLSKYHSNPVALVEAPKTAIYGTLYLGRPEKPENFIWLAVYNKSSFSFDKLKALKGRFVFVFPDLSKNGNTFKEWKDKANDFEKQLPGTRFIFSDLLEWLADQELKENGADIADVLIKHDWRQFRNETPTPKLSNNVVSVENAVQTKTFFSQPEPLPTVEACKVEPVKREQPQDWSEKIKELENYFANTTLPKEPVRLNQCSTITDINIFIENHIATARANNGNKTFLLYLNRLQELKQVLNINSK